MKRMLQILTAVILIVSIATQSVQAQCNAPIVNNFTPNTGLIGSTVTITGANFDVNPANNVVYFGATKAVVTQASFGQLKVTVPVGASTAPISVTNACNKTAYSSVSFNGIFCPTPISGTTYQNVAAEVSGYGAYNMVSQDMDLDGKPDVLSLRNDGGLTIARNTSTTGSVSFTPYNFVLGQEVSYNNGQSIVTADFDGDGKRDVGSTYHVYRNTSTGPGSINLQYAYTFGTLTYVCGWGCSWQFTSQVLSNYQVGAGDFNRDGKIDMVGESGNVIYVALNTSTGVGNIGFSAPIAIANVGARCTGIQVADVDGDGAVDILATQGDGNRAVSLRNTTTAGSSSLSFETPEYWNSNGNYPYRCQIADFDKDGKIDLTTCNYNDPANTCIFRNTSTVGDISFGTPVNLPAPQNNYRIQVGDVNGDGLPDIVTKSLGVNVFSVYPNTSTGSGVISFGARYDYTSSAMAEVSGMAIGDMDGDFVPDIVTSGISSNTIRIHRNTSAQPDVTPPTALCKNITVALSPTGTATVTASQIDNGSGDACGIASLLINNAPSLNFTCANIGANQVTLKVTDRAGNISTCQAIVTVAPAAVIVSGQTTVCQGQTVALQANLGDSYQWQKDGVDIPGATAQNYTATTTGNYSVTVTNGGGCSGTSAPVAITVNSNPTVATTPSGNATICSGSLTLSASQSSIYQWKLNGNNISGATQQNYNATAAGTYTVQVVDLFGCSATSAPINVTVGAPATATITPSGSTAFCTGGSVTLTANSGSSYLWSNGATTQSITVTTAGSYTVNVTNASGCTATSAPTTVTVNPLPAATITANGPTEFCAGGSVNLSAPTGSVVGNAMTFGGRYASAPHTTANNLGAGTAYTIESWIRVTDNVNNTIVDKGDYNFLFQTHSNGNAGLGLYNRSFGWIYSAGVVPVNQWVHVAVTYDNRTVKFYQNGVLQGTYTASTNSTGDGGPLNIARQSPTTCACNIFDGAMDELRLWNVAKTQAAIQASMNATVPTNSAGLVAYYKFDEGTGSTISDATANANNATMVGAPLWQVPTTSPLASSGFTYLWSPGGATSSAINATTAGDYSVTVTNVATGCSATSAVTTVKVNSLPIIVCPSNITVDADAGQCGATVTFDAATVTGTPAPTVTYSHASGSFFPVGTTTVTVTATNSCGSATCTFTVTVKDNQPPVITCPASISINATSAAGAVVNYADATATDNCTVASISRIAGPASGSVFPIGTTTVTYRATDAVGNSTDCSFAVTITGLPPKIVSPGNQTASAALGTCGAVVNFEATETEGIPASTITYSHQPGSVFPVGVTTVTATATNAVGTSEVTFTVTVTDNENPTISGLSPVSVNADNGSCAATNVSLGTPVTGDNCGVASVSNNAPASYPVGSTTVTWTVTDIHGNSTTTTQVVTVTDNQAPVVLVNNITVYLDASGNVSITPAQINNGSTDNCGIASVTLDKTSFNCSNVGANTVNLTVTDIHGNSASVAATVTVIDNIKPTVNAPAAQVFCQNTAASYTVPAITVSDNCGIASVSYTITGATNRTGSGLNASGAFAVGNSTITWTVTDVNNNVTVVAVPVTVNPAPTATISVSTPDAFCNKLTLTANSSSVITGYTWSANSSAFASTQAIFLDNTNADGNYVVFVTDNKGCTSLLPVSYNYQKQNIISNYTILAYKEAELKEYNTVQTGSVGVMSKKGEAEIGKYSSVAAPGAFVKAPKIEVKSGANVPTRIQAVATVTLPTMQYNNTSVNNLPNFTTNQNATITLSGNYKNLTVRKGSNVVLTGNTYGNINIEEGSTVRFTSTTINVEHLKVGKGKDNGQTVVRFADNTSVLVAKHVQIEEDCFINPDSYKVTFYLGRQSNHNCNSHRGDDRDDDDHDRGHGDGDQKFEVKGGNTTVIANVYAPTGDIKVKGGESCHKNHVATTVRMTGLFIGYEVEGDGKNVIWNNYTCGSAMPMPAVNNTAMVVGEEQEADLKLDVKVFSNPTLTHFEMIVSSDDKQTPVQIRVLSGAGRVLDAMKATVGQRVQFGQEYTSGMYVAEVVQDNKRKTVKLIKGK